MAVVTLCRNQTTFLLIRAIIYKTNLGNESLFTDEQTFLDEILTQKLSFALLTSEFVSQTHLFADIHLRSPDTRTVVCVLPDAAKTPLLLHSLADLDAYALCTLPELDDCLQAITNGYTYTSILLTAYPVYFQQEPLHGWNTLTKSERQVLKLMAEGQNGPLIAQSLCISQKTVENHKTKISQKLNVSGIPGSLVKFSLINREKILSTPIDLTTNKSKQ